MLRKVKLYGELAEFVGHKELDAVINSTADAIRFLITNFPKLEAHMAQRYYKVLIDDYEIGKEDIHNPTGKSDINIVPVITGASGNFGKVLLGGLLIGAAILVPGAAPALAGTMFTAGSAGASALVVGMANIGMSIAMMGVSELLSPAPDVPEEAETLENYAFSGVTNVARVGTPVPIAYGRLFVGSSVISSGLDVDQVV